MLNCQGVKYLYHAAGALGLFLASTAAASSPVLERVLPLEVRTGVIRIRTVEAPLIRVPEDSQREPVTWSEAQFSRVYAFEFFVETRRADGADVLDENGTLLVAVRVGAEDLLALDERIRDYYSSLGADSFGAPLAGFHDGAKPFDRLAFDSIEPSWTCKIGEQGSRASDYRRQYRTEDGRQRPAGGASSEHLGEVTERLCPELLRVAAGAGAREVRTLPAPREVRELVVSVESSDNLPMGLRAQELASSLPSGVSVSRHRVEDDGSAMHSHTGSDGTHRATFLLEGTEWRATTVPSYLSPDLLAQGAFVSRWTLTETDRRLGVNPKREVRTSVELVLGLVPVDPPPFEGEQIPSNDEDAELVAVELEAEALRAEVARRLDAQSTIDAAVLEKALTDRPEGLRSAGWLLVLCRQDGTASFGLPPTQASSPIKNPALFCAALDRGQVSHFNIEPRSRGPLEPSVLAPKAIASIRAQTTLGAVESNVEM